MTWLFPYFIVATLFIPETGSISTIRVGPFETLEETWAAARIWCKSECVFERNWRWVEAVHVDE